MMRSIILISFYFMYLLTAEVESAKTQKEAEYLHGSVLKLLKYTETLNMHFTVTNSIHVLI